MKKTLSVVTALLNQVDTVEETLESVSAIRSLGVEHIVVDGGSNDGTLDVLDRYRSSIDVMISESDRGISDAFNKGISQSSGQYVSILNGDDRFRPEIRDVLSGIRNGRYSSDILYGDVIQFDAVKGVREHCRADIGQVDRYMSVYHPAMLVKRAVYESVGVYDLGYKLAMDSDFVHRCVAHNIGFEHVGCTLAEMRLGGISHRNIGSAMYEFQKSVVSNGLSSTSKAIAYRWRQTLLHYVLSITGVRSVWASIRGRSLKN